MGLEGISTIGVGWGGESGESTHYTLMDGTKQTNRKTNNNTEHAGISVFFHRGNKRHSLHSDLQKLYTRYPFFLQ